MSEKTVACEAAKTTLTVGEKILLTCKTEGLGMTSASRVEFRDLAKTEPFTLEFISEPELAPDVLKQVVTSYRVGNHELDGLFLVVDGRSYKVPKLSLQVQTVIQAGEGAQPTPYPLVDPIEVAAPWWWWAIWITVILGLASYGLWTFLKWQKARRLAARLKEVSKPLTPVEKFRQKMRKLDSHGYHQKGEYKAFALELTSILKSAIGEQFRFPAEDLTSEELNLNLQQKFKTFYNSAGQELQSVLSELDQIKFAKTETSAEHCLRLMDRTLKIGQLLFGVTP
jgi:hypothetical protein